MTPEGDVLRRVTTLERELERLRTKTERRQAALLAALDDSTLRARDDERAVRTFIRRWTSAE